MDSNLNQNKIAIFHTSLFGGGGEKVLLDLAKGFALDGISVDLLLGTTKGQFSKKVEGVNVIDLHSKRIIYNLPKLVLYLRKNRPTALLTTAEHASIIALLAKMFSFTKTRIFIRIGNPYSILLNGYNNFFDKRIIVFLIRLLYPSAFGFIANAKGVAGDFSRTLNINCERISVIHNPKFIEEIKEKSREEVKHKWLTQKDAPVIISNARTFPQKDIDTLLHAVALVKEKKDIRLILIGHGSRDELLFQAKKLGIDDSVDILGFVENPYTYMAHSDVFVLPSLWEGLPNALIEALICGVPTIATDCIGGGSREILAPNTDVSKRMEKGIEYAEYGILTATKDVESIAQAILRLLDDKELSEKYIKKGLERAQDFSHDKIIKRYSEVLLNNKKNTIIA